MNTRLYSTALLVFVAAFLSDHQVNCKCGTQGLVDTPWAACLVAEEDQCPNNFIKVDDDGTCKRIGRIPDEWKPRVCCLMTPLLEFKIKDAPCLAGSPSTSNDVEKKSHKYH